ncbi:MAG: dihydroorotate dehydrogenase-like protein [Candidatus Mcinerneyibacterium aminivorans]|uniref:Dihydroorotate dehydrogenase-like protein n=1 Tax=Candidatus Mcinerneyibacterium aminivorans TaxID=2703815 RepID=A0A5D0MHM3_9BACT|nr:MAG: dihydroorotate dehydrogenase-like protein [Candidatus Mcinerneyibacterium aminivorans]
MLIKFPFLAIIKEQGGNIMSDLKTNYMGLELKNPFVIGSSGLTSNLDDLKKCEDNNASAVVLKSLFQEQFIKKSQEIEGYLNYSHYEEVYDYIRNTTDNFGQQNYLKLIENAKKKLDIPVIASINCTSTKGWLKYAEHIEEAGADGLELNISFLPTDVEIDSNFVESKYIEILKKVKNKIDLPIALKIGPYFTAFKNFADKLSVRGADALVLFNRFYQFDIDIENLSLKAGNHLSSSDDLSTSLRWIALLSAEIENDFAATTGVHHGPDAVKQLLAGAKVVQLCSTIYKNGFEQINSIKNFLESWMDRHGYKSINQFRGLLNQSESEYPQEYERMQYIEALTKEKNIK